MQASSALSIAQHRRARHDELKTAREAWFSGDFRACIAALDGAEATTGANRTESVLLRARALLRLGDAEAALSVLRGAEKWFVGADAVTTLRMLLGSAIARVESEGAGLEILDDAAAFGRTNGAHGAVLAEVDYYRSLVYFTRRELEAAERIAGAVVESDADIIAARAGQLVSLIDAARGDHVRSYHRALEALRTLYGCGHRDDHLAANLQHQIAVYEAELLGSIAIPQWRLRLRDGSERASQAAREARTGTALYSAYAALLEDDERRAFAQAGIADMLAPSDGYRSRALATRATVSRVYGELRNARQFIAHATELADGHDWDASSDDEAIGLLVVAEELRWYDAQRANGLVDRYERIGRQKDALLIRTRDARYRALQDLLIGAVRAMSGRRDLDTIERLRRACSTFKAIGYLSRAAWALIELDEAYRRMGVTAPDEYFLSGAQQIIQEHFARSFLARRIGTWGPLGGESLGIQLTAAQREVLQGLCAGRSTDEIAASRGCSPITVRNHIDATMKRFGVHSRTALVRELAMRGWIGCSEPAFPAVPGTSAR